MPLRHLLAAVFTVFMKTKGVHWHIGGRHFRDYHLLLDEQASQLFAMVDEIAERARKVGETLRSVSEITRNQRLQDNDDGRLSPADMLKEGTSGRQPTADTVPAQHPRGLRSAPRRCHGQPARELDRRSRAAELVPCGNNARQLNTYANHPPTKSRSCEVRAFGVCAPTFRPLKSPKRVGQPAPSRCCARLTQECERAPSLRRNWRLGLEWWAHRVGALRVYPHKH